MGVFRDDLAELPLFSEVSRSEMAVVRRHLTPLRIPAGRVLVQEGTRGDEFMIIAHGEATVSQGGHIVATLGRGDLVGEMALLDPDGSGRRNATVKVDTDAVIYAGSRGGVPPDSGLVAFRGSQGEGNRCGPLEPDGAARGLSHIADRAGASSFSMKMRL